MLAKARHYVPQQHLINVYHAIFASHLMYGAQVWSPKLVAVKKTVSRLQKSALRIITFSEFKAHHEPLCKQLSIVKFIDNIEISNCLFVHDFLNNNLPDSYINIFTRVDDTDSNSTTRQASTGMIHIPRYTRVRRILMSSLSGSRPKSAEMETVAQRRASMDDSFHLPNFPHMAWVDPSALPTIVIVPSLRARLECISLHRYGTLVSQRVPHPHSIS